MIIKLENFNNYLKENKAYNDDIRSLIHELFQTDGLGKIDYITSDFATFNSNKRLHYFKISEGKPEYLRPQQDDISKNYANYNNVLGPQEFSLASYLLNKDLGYNVIILTGALGSGKSSLSNYVLDFLKKASLLENDPLFFPKDGQMYRINFNNNQGSDKEDIANQFKEELTAKLINVISDIHKAKLFINVLIDFIEKDSLDDFASFKEFVRKLKKQHLTTEEQKFEYLLDWLDSYEHFLSYKLRLVSYLLKLVQEICYPDNRVNFIFFVDNIDSFPDDVQMEILHVIFSFSIKLPIRILMPMRLTTFGKIKGNGSYSFAVYPNNGRFPLDIFVRRINHFLQDPGSYKLTQKISSENVPRLIDKMNFLIKTIIERHSSSRLSNFYTAIAGNSIRRGLYLGERFFLNSAVRYNDENLYQDDFLRSLLISENDSGKFSTNDSLVSNIFCSLSTGGENTLIKVRILQILSFFKENNIECTMNVLLSQLALFEEYSSSEILEAINTLIFYRRRLAYIEGVSEYSDINNLYQSMNDVVSITYSGTEYLNTLLYDIVYLQNSFLVLNWKIPKSMRSLSYLEGYINELNRKKSNTNINYLMNLIKNKSATITDFISPGYNYIDIKERMKMVRECLNFLLINDLHQLAIYYENNNIKNADIIENRYIKESFVIEMIGKISINVLHILKNNMFNAPEIENWYNFLIIADLWQMQIFKSPNVTVVSSLSIYEKDIGGHLKIN